MSQKWYGNISAFKINEKFELTQEQLLEKLEKKKIIPCDNSLNDIMEKCSQVSDILDEIKEINYNKYIII